MDEKERKVPAVAVARSCVLRACMWYMSKSNAESERKLLLNSCHCELIISDCLTHISSVNHGKCGQRRAFIEVKSLFYPLVF